MNTKLPAVADAKGRPIGFLHQRTELVNALRSVLYEYGHVFPKGIAHLKRIEAVWSCRGLVPLL